MHRVSRRRDGRPPGRAQHTAHEGREGALLLATIGSPLLGRFGLIAVAITRAFGARLRGIHFTANCSERGGLAQAKL